MNFNRIFAAIKQHIWGPVGSVVFHVLLVLLILRLASTANVIVEPGISAMVMDIKPMKDMEQIQKDIEQLRKPEELTPQNEAVDTAEVMSSVSSVDDSRMAEDFAGAGPGSSPGFGTTSDQIAGLDVASDANSPLRMLGLFEGRSSGGGGSNSSFGYSRGISGDLIGTMYDLKRDARGRARNPDYVADLREMLAGHLKPAAFSSFYRITNQLFLTHLFVPVQPAENGPADFGVTDMEPRNWVVHYSGEIAPPEPGRYRFVGMFDDLLMVLIDGKVTMEFLWTGDPTPWAPTENVDTHMCFAGRPLVYGDWIEMSPSKPRHIDILVGEHPGGKVGGVLMIQQQGRTYENDPHGRPVLPVFTVQMLSPAERTAINSNPAWQFENPAPIFSARSRRIAAPVNKDDNSVKVDVI